MRRGRRCHTRQGRCADAEPEPKTERRAARGPIRFPIHAIAPSPGFPYMYEQR